ncbi:MAG: sensor protein KdpD [Bacteroidetes bacterium]|nr:sensor protein KdpD [Bacteroidota bacterium]
MSRERSVENFLDLIRRSRSGRLKIYIGLAAGVGKTYRMLDEARSLRSLGVNVLVGYVETHGRRETEEKLEGLPQLARKKLFYRGRQLEEFDIDDALARHPDVIVVDELAHSNAPGSHNEKRYQDVEELLNAGINVISAVNIQHLESLNHIVESITGVEVSERIPDSILKRADEVVNLDLTADELIARLKEGKIYAPEKIELALRNFFQRDNLLKLRELALREVADQLERKIDVETSDVKKKQFGRIAVCLSENYTMAELLIRKAARLADRFAVQWYAVFVETPDLSSDKIDLAVQRHLINNFKLATQLGAHVDTLKGSNVGKVIAAFAREKNIQLLIVGKSAPKRFPRLFGTSIVDALMEELEDDEIDIQVVSK